MRHRQYPFSVSGSAIERLKQLREETGQTMFNEFRRLAWLLSMDKIPRFEVDGDKMFYTIHVPMTSEQYASLVIVAARYGIPKYGIGEMVLSYYPKEIV